MKLRTAIDAADKVFIEISRSGNPIRFSVAKKEVNRVIDDYYLDSDLGSDVWSGNEVFWDKSSLVLSYT